MCLGTEQEWKPGSPDYLDQAYSSRGWYKWKVKMHGPKWGTAWRWPLSAYEPQSEDELWAGRTPSMFKASLFWMLLLMSCLVVTSDSSWTWSLLSMGSSACPSLFQGMEGVQEVSREIQNHSRRNVLPHYSLVNRQLWNDRAWLSQMSLASSCKVSVFDVKWAENKQMWRTMKNHLTFQRPFSLYWSH